MLAGTRRLDGGVEREQVGLLGNGGDDLQDLLDVAALRRDLIDGFGRALQYLGQVMDGDGRLADDPRTGLDLLVGALRCSRGTRGEARHLVHRRGHLVDRRGDLLSLGRLVLDLLIAVCR